MWDCIFISPPEARVNEDEIRLFIRLRRESYKSPKSRKGQIWYEVTSYMCLIIGLKGLKWSQKA